MEADDPRVPLPGRGAVVAEVAAEHVEGEAEAAGQLAAPVLQQPGRRDHQDPGRLAPGDQLADEHAGLDGLAQPDLVGHQQPPRRSAHQVVDQQDLVGQEVHPAGGQLAAGVGVGEVEGHLADAVVLGVVEVARGEALPQIRRLLQPLDGQALHPLALVRLEQHLGLVDPEGLGHAQHLAGAPLRMPPDPDLVVRADLVDRGRLAHDRLKEASPRRDGGTLVLKRARRPRTRECTPRLVGPEAKPREQGIGHGSRRRRHPAVTPHRCATALASARKSR